MPEVCLVVMHLQLAQATSLKLLDSSFCRWITDDSMLPLRSLASLTHVDMSQSLDLTSAGLAALAGWTAIQNLHLAGAIKAISTPGRVEYVICCTTENMIFVSQP